MAIQIPVSQTGATSQSAGRAQQMEVIARIAQMFEEITDFQEQARHALTELGRIAGIERLNLRWVDDATGELRLVARVSSEEGGVVARPTHSVNEGVSGLAFRKQQTIVSEDFASDPNAPADAVERGVASVMAVPILDRGQAKGTITLSSKEKGYFNSKRVPFLEAASRSIGALLLLALLYDAERHRTQELEAALNELRAAQEQLVHSARLAAVGELLAGVTHELNNSIGAIVGYIELLMTRGITPESTRWVGIVHEQARHAQGIVADLLSFSRKHEFEKVPLRVNEIVLKAIRLRDYQLRKSRITVTRRLARRLPPVLGDTRRLQQVLVNLMSNAEQAMAGAHGAGTLTITTELTAGRRVRISTSDDGPGIARNHLDRLFQPFFTTKPVGEGTGLGLSVSYGIVRDHGGEIWAESTLGKGATFIVELPASA